MDPIIGGALISAGSSLFGGLFGKKPPTSGQNSFSHVSGIMRASEKFGFNPLTLLGSVGAVGGGTPQNYMGAAIADAGLAYANGMTEKGRLDQIKRSNDLEEANLELRRKVEQMTIRPKVGGIYAANQQTPTLAQSLGVQPSPARTVGDVGVIKTTTLSPLPAAQTMSDYFGDGVGEAAGVVNYGRALVLSASDAMEMGLGKMGIKIDRSHNYFKDWAQPFRGFATGGK